MNAKDIRIGNTIMFGERWISVSHHDIDNMARMELTEGVISDIYRPIPLTEEWMLKMGFIKVSSNYEKEWLLLWKNLKTGTIDFVMNEPHSNKRKITTLEYVHQLQNLYFALAGNDLNIK